MKIEIFILILFILLSKNLKSQVDSVEYGTITPDRFCTIFNDSIITKLTSYAYFENADYSYDDLVLIALAWNSIQMNIDDPYIGENLAKIPCLTSSDEKNPWYRFFDYVDDFWSYRTIYFNKGMLHLIQENKENSLFPYYKINIP